MRAVILLAIAALGTTVWAQEAKTENAPAAKTNLVFDGGFDIIKKHGNSDRHWGYNKDGVFYGWSTAANGEKDISWAELDDKTFVSAPNSMKIEIKQDKNPIILNQSLHYYNIKLEPNKKYKISCMVKLQDVTKNGIALNLTHGGNNTWSSWITGTSDWKKLEYNYTAPEDSDKIKQLDLNIRFYGTGTVWVDDVCVEEL